MEKLKEILTSKQAKTFYWTIANGFISLAIIYCAELEWIYAPMVIATLNLITKYINQTYLTESDTTL